MLKRVLDILLSFIGIITVTPIYVLIALLIKLNSKGPVLYCANRIGKDKKCFRMYKFRTMIDAAVGVGDSLSPKDDPRVTPVGRFLRRTKLNELPQLINVLKGEMSLVGPRPCLFNQDELIAEREARGVFDVLPGITGLAQVNEIDMSTPVKLAEWDQKMIQNMSVISYFTYIIQTVSGKGTGDRIK